MALTPKQQRFVDEYLRDLNATQAAIRAGYSARSAEVTSSRLLGNPKIREAIQIGMEAQKARTQIDADWITNRLRKEAEYSGFGASHSARVKAIELLGKRIAYFPADGLTVDVNGKVDHQHQGQIGVSIATDIDQLTDAFVRAASREKKGDLPTDDSAKPVDS